MITVDVYTQSKGISGKHIWHGYMGHLPRVGEYIVFGNGGSAEEVIEIFHFLYDNDVWLVISPDYQDKYIDLD